MENEYKNTSDIYDILPEKHDKSGVRKVLENPTKIKKDLLKEYLPLPSADDGEIHDLHSGPTADQKNSKA